MHRNSDRMAGPWRVIRYRNNLAASPAMSRPKAEVNSERWRPRYGALRVDAVRTTSSSGSSTRLSRAGVSQPDMTSLQPTIWPSSNSHQSEFGCDQRNAKQGRRHRALQQHEGIAEADGERAAQLAFGDRPQDEADDDRRDRKIEPAHQKAQKRIAFGTILKRVSSQT